MEGLARRDALVMGYAQRNQVPTAVTLAGGYARKLDDTVSIHVNTIKAAIQAAQRHNVRPVSPSP
jgi:acetoin utilization deacetylase AcuC-like enzyme